MPRGGLRGDCCLCGLCGYGVIGRGSVDWVWFRGVDRHTHTQVCVGGKGKMVENGLRRMVARLDAWTVGPYGSLGIWLIGPSCVRCS